MSVKRKISVALVVVILILVGVVALVIWPTITDIRKISNAIYLERIDLEKKYLRGQLLRKTVDDFEKIKPTIEKDHTHNKEEALLDFYRKMRPTEPATVEVADALFFRLFF